MTYLTKTMATIGALIVTQLAYAQTTLVVPFSPGGGGDTMARTMAPLLEKALSDTIVVTNKAGAAGNIGLSSVAKSTPDGKTLGYATFGTLCMNPKLYPGAKETVDSLQVLATMGRVPLILAVSKTKFPHVNTWADLVEEWKKHPEGLNIATAGVGSASGEGARRLEEVTHLPQTAINFQGAGPALLSLEGGHTDIMMDTPPNLLKADPKRVTLLMITSETPLGIAPHLPTAKSLGLGDLTHGVWDALVIPKGTSLREVKHLEVALARFLAEPELKTLFEARGVEMFPHVAPDINTLCGSTP